MAAMSRTPRRRRRWLGAVAAVSVVVAGLALIGAVALRNGRAAEDALTRARSHIQQATAAARAGDLEGAVNELGTGADEAQEARALLTRQPLSAVQAMPFVGATARKGVAVADTAARSAATGERLLSAVQASGTDLAALSLDLDSPVWLDQLVEIQRPLTDALVEMRDIRATFVQVPERTRVERIDTAGDQLLSELDQAIGLLETGADLAGVLPVLFGQGGTQRYFVGAQNPAEQRPLGGIMGAYGFLTAINGRASLSQFISVGTLPGDLLDVDTAPSEEFLNRYGTAYLGRGSWSNVNSSPDFPSVATVIEAFAPEAVGQEIDGVIVLDPFAIQTFLRVTGPVETELGTLRAGTVIEQVIRDAPEQFDSQGDRKAAIGIAAETVLEAFLASDADPRARFEALAEVVGDGHLLVHHTNPDVQESLSRLGVTGELLPAEPGNFAAIAFNTSESHVDYFTHQELDLNLYLNPDGSATGTMSVTIVNDAPTSGVPSYFIGPNVDGDSRFRAGDAVSLISLYCGPCNFTGVRSPDALELGRWYDNELGHRIANTVERAPAGDQVTVVHDFELFDLWDASGESGSVSPTLWYQPTINPTEYRMTIHAPLGWRLVNDDGANTASTTIDGVLTRTTSHDLRLVRDA
jgi:hypothetical protein